MAVTQAPPSVGPRSRAARLDWRDAAGSDWAFFALLLGAAALYYLGPATWVSILGWLAFVGLALRRPDLAIAVVLLALPFAYHPRTWGRLQFAPAELLLIGVTLAWAVRDGPALARWTGAIVRRKIGWRTVRDDAVERLGRTFAAPFLLFGLAAALSLVLPRLVEPRVAVREFRTVIVEPMILYLLVLRFIHTRRQVEWLIDALIVSAAIVGRFGVEQFLFNRGAWEMDGVSRVSSFYPSATALGLYLGRVLPLVVALALAGLSPGRRIGYAILGLPILAGLFLSWTRAAWIGDFVAIALMIVLIGRRWAAFGFLGASVLGAIGLLMTRPERITALFSAGEGTHISRVVIWESAVNVIRERPFTGAGLDQFVHLDAAKYGIPHVRFMLYSHPHNWILDFWIRLGLLGLVAIVWLLARFYLVAVPLVRRPRDPYLAGVALGLIGSVTHLVVHGLFDLTFFQADLAFLFWLALGLTEVLRRSD